MIRMKRFRVFTFFLRHFSHIALFGMLLLPLPFMVAALTLNELHALAFYLCHKNTPSLFKRLGKLAYAELFFTLLGILLLPFSLLTGMWMIGINIMISDLFKVVSIFPERIRSKPENRENKIKLSGKLLLKAAALCLALCLYAKVHFLFYFSIGLYFFSFVFLVLVPCAKWTFKEEFSEVDTLLHRNNFIPSSNFAALDAIVEAKPHDDDDELIPRSSLPALCRCWDICYTEKVMDHMTISTQQEQTQGEEGPGLFDCFIDDQSLIVEANPSQTLSRITIPPPHNQQDVIAHRAAL